MSKLNIEKYETRIEYRYGVDGYAVSIIFFGDEFEGATYDFSGKYSLEKWAILKWIGGEIMRLQKLHTKEVT